MSILSPLLPLALALLSGCAAGPPPSPEPPAEAAAASGPAPAAAEPPAATETLSGTLRHKPWSKTEESFRAGGSDYFVLEPDPAGATSPEGRILLPSGAVPAEQLLALDGQRVEVTGTEVPGRPFVPDPTSQYPVGMNGEPAVKEVGGGLMVLTIRAAAP